MTGAASFPEKRSAELAAFLAKEPDLTRLLHPQEDEPDIPSYELLCSGASPYYVIRVPIRGRSGSLWVSRLPGLRATYTENEFAALSGFGVDRIVCLVPTDALQGLHGAYRYLSVVERFFPHGFHQLEIPDHEIPPDDLEFERLVEHVDDALHEGERVLVHCVGGCGRTGMFASCLLIRSGLSAVDAIREFRRRRRCGPETPEQIAYVARYAERVRETSSNESFLAGTVTLSRDSSGQPKLLERGGFGSVFIGRLKVSGKRSRRVAIKQFHRGVSDRDAERTQRCIESLRNAGVMLPRMAMCKMDDGSWVQIAPLFGSARRGSKLCQPSRYYKLLREDDKLFAIEQLTLVANAGYTPSLDLFVMFKDPSQGIVPLDLDLVEIAANAQEAARRLLSGIIQIGSERDERDRLLGASVATANEELRDAMEMSLSGQDNAFRTLWNLD